MVAPWLVTGMKAVKLALPDAKSVAGDLDTKMFPILASEPNCDSRQGLAEPFRTCVRHEGVFRLAREAKSARAAFTDG
jgi:hypothetical protein